MALKSESKVLDSILTFTCVDKDDEALTFSKDVDLSLFGYGKHGALADLAIAFAVRTALRNSTGGREIDEAEAAVDARIDAWTKGEWGAERGGDASGAPFTPGHILAKAVAAVYASKFATPADAALQLSTMLEQSLQAAGHPSFAELDEENQRKARNTFVKNARAKDAKLDAAVAQITAQMAANRAAKVAEKAGKDEGGSLF